MIGVLSKASETKSVREFFQLFKTPWEYWNPHRRYDLIVLTREEVPKDLKARVLLICSSQATELDDHLGLVAKLLGRGNWLKWKGSTFPVYGDVAVFQPVGRSLLTAMKTGGSVGQEIASGEGVTVRIGFDLFSEVAFLLTQGQPPENALIPTLDTLVSLLRDILIGAGVAFVEVPPVRSGYDFMVCLTHDVDFIGIRDHKFDHTMWGFLNRSSVGALVRAIKGRLPWSKCIECWKAALSLPLVHLGLRDDFWLEFERFIEIEKKFGSTFYFIPFKNVAGTLAGGPAPKRRAAKYDMAAVHNHVHQLTEAGCEIGLHGLDAWQSCESAQAEVKPIRQATGKMPVGTRMHWLYWSEESAKSLEDAGFGYDSTFGYNDAVGFRAGTTQAFCPLAAENLLELSLNIQDSAMFYSDRMKLSESDALDRCKGVIDTAVSLGGSITVNWHTRSLSPDRLWGDFYANLLRELQRHRVWFGRAQDIVSWFRKRRALCFDSVQFEGNHVRVALSGASALSEDAFTVRLYHPRITAAESGSCTDQPIFTDRLWSGEALLDLSY